MRRRLAAGLLGLCTAAAFAGCQRSEVQSFEGECVEELVWRGVDWAGHPHRPAFGERLGRTKTLACGKPFQGVTIHRILGIDPSVAIAVKRDEPGGRRRYLSLGPGYVVQSPEHPFHRVVYGSDDLPDAYEDQICRGKRTVLARVTRAPLGDERWLTVRAARSKDARFVQGRGVRGVLSIDAGTAVEELERGGIPYVERGERLRLVLRACRGGPQADEGLRGLDSLVVVRMARAD